MATHLRWNPHYLASVLHAAREIARGAPTVDVALRSTLQRPADDLAHWVAVSGLDGERFWEQLIPLASRSDSSRALAENTLVKLRGRGQASALAVAELAGLVASAEQAVRVALPGHADELRLRVGPLRELWDARGPGLLVCLRNLLGDQILPAEAEILPVHPLCGGGGDAYIAYNSVSIEAVLTNVSPQLPETVRLGWLTGQLQLELPHFSENLPPKMLPAVGALGLVLPSLTAAEEVELVRNDPPTLQLAWQLWRLDRFAPVAFAQTLRDWWQVYVDTRPPFRTALLALAKLLSQLSEPQR